MMLNDVDAKTGRCMSLFSKRIDKAGGSCLASKVARRGRADGKDRRHDR